MNSKNSSNTPSVAVPQPMAHYFVDESGDGVLFGKQGKVLLGQPGVCDQFMLGMLRAFRQALDVSRCRFESQWNKTVDTPITLSASSPNKDPCLQAVDYMLWALQRYYNQQESRFIELLWDKVGLIHAVDDKTKAAYGAYYTKKNPLPELPGAGL
jgi:hypothetical protein